MAEHVQNAMLNMSLELEIMKNHLNHKFSDAEIKSFREKCRTFEYKIKSLRNRLEDYQNYRNFLDQFLVYIREMSENEKQKPVEWKNLKNLIQKRLYRIYNEMLEKFGYNFDVCLEYYTKFYDNEKRGPIQRCINKLIESHSTNEQSWLLAVKWYEEHCGDHGRGQIYLSTGLKSCIDGKLLYKAAIKYELQHIHNLYITEEEKVREASKIQSTYIADILRKNIKDFNFYVELIELLRKYSFAGAVIDCVNEKLRKENSDEPKIVWFLAQRVIDEARMKDIDELEVIQQCVNTYKDGFTMMVSKEKKIELTDLFLDHIIKFKQGKPLRSQLINEYMQMAHKESILLESHYIYWLHLCEDNDTFASAILTKGVESNPESVKLWKMYLQHKIRRNGCAEDVYKAFELGLAKTKNKALPLWNAFLRFAMLEEAASNCEPTKTIEIFKRAIAQTDEISQAFKVKYLEWAIINTDTTTTRKIYDEISAKPPYIKELHVSMLNYESVPCKKRRVGGFGAIEDLENTEKIHIRACQQFEKDADVWLSYMDFVKNDEEKKSAVFKRATEKLEGMQLVQFKHKCSMKKTKRF